MAKLPHHISILSLIFCLFPFLAGSSWVDPDTKAKYHHTKAHTKDDNRPYRLVFSDEFETEGRSFADGTDSRWTALHKNDYTNNALHFYSHDNAVTTNGVLNITTEQKINTYKAFDEKKKTFYADKKYIQSAMLQSWNKFCFIGGIVEFSAKLPGDPKIGGLWPALWMMGNLARATYVGSSDFVWPFSYNKCDSNTRQSQEINACKLVNHFGMDEYTGRGSPEIDVIEAMQGESGKLPNTFIQRPYQSASLQVAPGIEIDRPELGHRPHQDHWYNNLKYGNTSKTQVDLNPFFYGVKLEHKPTSKTYQADALSANMQLNDTHFKHQHIYRVEWEPPHHNGTGGYLKWYSDGEFVFSILGESLSVMGTEIPSEPMYLMMNTAVSSKWGFPAPCPENCKCDCFECGDPSCSCALPAKYCDNFPASFEIDYVRVYQAVDDSKHILGCSPESRPTAKFIAGHQKRFMVEGDRQPLLDVQSGGGTCVKGKDCGGRERGQCESGYCVCSSNTTGPFCLSHFGFYDHDTSKPTLPFSLSNIIVPKSLALVVVALILGFMFSIQGTIRIKSKEHLYEKVANADVGASGLRDSTNVPTSYQNSTVMNYAMPPQGKANTYCVIDSRLMEN